nr:AT-rich interactive domain-containing protein 1-like [Lolium perenne]
MDNFSTGAERVNCNISYLSRDPPKRAITDPVKHQASVPGWENKPSKKEADDYKAKTLEMLGTIVCPLNMDIPLTVDHRHPNAPRPTPHADLLKNPTDAAVLQNAKKERVDKCNCSHPRSEDCVLVHVQKARSWIKEQLGEEAFKNCGLDVMGDQVEELWTAVDKKKLEDVYKSIPQNEHQTFMKIALKEHSDKEKERLARYYYNVFLPRRLASFTRAGHKHEDVDTGDEKSSESDDNNERRPRKKSKSSGSSSSKRCRKWNIQKNR